MASLLIALLAACAGAAEPSWPCFHGPDRTNRSPETGLLKTWPEGGPKLLWTASGLGRGYSSVSIADGRIYSAGMIDKQTFVLAFSLEGKPIWKTLNGESWSTTRRWAIGYAGSRATPTFDDGRVYHLSERGRLACLDAATGKAVWSTDLLKRFDAKVSKYGYAESVLLDGDHLICTPAGEKGVIACLDKTTGRTVWATTGIPGDAAYASPVLAEFGGVTQVLGQTSSRLFAVDRRTGKRLWAVTLENQRDNNCTDPLFHKGHVLASSGYGTGSLLVKLSAADGRIAAKEVWRSALMDNHHGGIVRVGEHVYGAGHQKRGWFCLDLMTGRPLWNARGKGSLTFADGMLYCLDERGTISLVEATPKALRVAGSFDVPKGGSGLYWAHPVVCGGRLYVRHADKLYAYDVKAP
jgi:outer membrane protein assembly factor BamB